MRRIAGRRREPRVAARTLAHVQQRCVDLRKRAGTRQGERDPHLRRKEVEQTHHAGLARRCTIQLSYAIGVAEPLSLYVDLHGTGTVEEAKLEAALPQLVRLTPKGIREHLKLNAPIYSKTAAYGHFGRTPEGDLFTWEKTDLVDALKAKSLSQATNTNADTTCGDFGATPGLKF